MTTHIHKWFYLETKTKFEMVKEDLFRQVEYGYYVCNSCPETFGEPNTIRRKISHD